MPCVRRAGRAAGGSLPPTEGRAQHLIPLRACGSLSAPRRNQRCYRKWTTNDNSFGDGFRGGRWCMIFVVRWQMVTKIYRSMLKLEEESIIWSRCSKHLQACLWLHKQQLLTTRLLMNHQSGGLESCFNWIWDHHIMKYLWGTAIASYPLVMTNTSPWYR